MPRGRSRSQRSASLSVGLDLLLECVDDPLEPAQVAAFKRAEAEYREALKKIAAAKEQNVEIVSEDGTIIHHAKKPPPPAPADLQISVVTRPKRGGPGKSGNKQPDVIVVDDEPAPAAPTPTHIRAANNMDVDSVSPQLAAARNVLQQQLNKASAQPAMQVPVQGQQLLLRTADGQTMLVQSQSVPGGHVINQPVAGMPYITSQVQNTSVSGANGMQTPNGPDKSSKTSSKKAKRQAAAAAMAAAAAAAGGFELVPNTQGLGLKRSADSELIPMEPSKKGRAGKGAKEADTGTGTMVPLDEYYYGKKEGDPTYREEKGEYRFKCWYCHKMLYNNLRIMLHMQGHIDSEKQQNLDLSDLTQCKHCYKQFDTPFEMQCHVEKIHQLKSNVLVCRICEKDMDSQSQLRQHMRQCHQACEMPYICQLCNFRSSIYSDVVDHFKKRHDSSQYVLCLYCLRVFTVSFSKTQGWGLTQNYYNHLQKHQLKATSKKCSCCKLTFLTKQECKLHRNKDHMANYKGILGASTGTTITPDQEQVMIKVPDRMTGATAGRGQLKSLNAPQISKVQELRCQMTAIKKRNKCLECGKPMNLQDHYKKYIECSMCRYATTCSHAYSNHMMGYHSGTSRAQSLLRRRKGRPMDSPMYCLCGYQGNYGNMIANHLVSCSKRTCYSNKPETKYFEYDDEQEDFNPFEPYIDEPETPEKYGTPERDIPSLFGALGLVKKPPKAGSGVRDSSSRSESPELTSTAIAEGIVGHLVDEMFPAETAAEKALEGVLSAVDRSINRSVAAATAKDKVDRSNLTGEKKWEAVRLKGPKSPSKYSIFLGGSKSPKKDKTKEKAKEDTQDKDSSKDAPAGLAASSEDAVPEEVQRAAAEDGHPASTNENTLDAPSDVSSAAEPTEQVEEAKEADQDRRGGEEVPSSADLPSEAAEETLSSEAKMDTETSGDLVQQEGLEQDSSKIVASGEVEEDSLPVDTTEPSNNAVEEHGKAAPSEPKQADVEAPTEEEEMDTGEEQMPMDTQDTEEKPQEEETVADMADAETAESSVNEERLSKPEHSCTPTLDESPISSEMDRNEICGTPVQDELPERDQQEETTAVPAAESTVSEEEEVMERDEGQDVQESLLETQEEVPENQDQVEEAEEELAEEAVPKEQDDDEPVPEEQNYQESVPKEEEPEPEPVPKEQDDQEPAPEEQDLDHPVPEEEPDPAEPDQQGTPADEQEKEEPEFEKQKEVTEQADEQEGQKDQEDEEVPSEAQETDSKPADEVTEDSSAEQPKEAPREEAPPEQEPTDDPTEPEVESKGSVEEPMQEPAGHEGDVKAHELASVPSEAYGPTVPPLTADTSKGETSTAEKPEDKAGKPSSAPDAEKPRDGSADDHSSTDRYEERSQDKRDDYHRQSSSSRDDRHHDNRDRYRSDRDRDRHGDYRRDRDYGHRDYNRQHDHRSGDNRQHGSRDYDRYGNYNRDRYGGHHGNQGYYDNRHGDRYSGHRGGRGGHGGGYHDNYNKNRGGYYGNQGRRYY